MKTSTETDPASRRATRLSNTLRILKSKGGTEWLGRLGGALTVLAFLLTTLSSRAGRSLESDGRVADRPDWRDESAPDRPAESFGKGMKVNGWLLFGSDQLSDGFGDTSHRDECMPGYVDRVLVAQGARVGRFAGYDAVPVPRAGTSIGGTLTLDATNGGETEVLSIRVGVDAPPVLRLAVLTDNLGSPDYAAKGIGIAIDGREGSLFPTTPNGSSDWVIWNLPRLREGTEISLRVKPNMGVAAVGGVMFLSTSANGPRKTVAPGPLPVADRKIGEFSRAGEYLKDYYVFKEGATFHLFYNVGNAGESQQWFEAGNEKAFGHATTLDFKTWKHHPRVLEVVPSSWEGMVVSAPSIIKHDGTYYLFYTGFDDRVPGKQTIGLATSKDLFQWERHKGNPVYQAPPWAERRADGWVDCRDSHVIRHGKEFLMFTTVAKAGGKGAIALATSGNLTDWKDAGVAVETFKEPESPRVFQHGSSFYMFISSAHGRQLLVTENPKSGPWREVPFRWPAPGLWSGWEVVEDGDRTVFSAFEWKNFGNHIRFWEVRWRDGVPEVAY